MALGATKSISKAPASIIGTAFVTQYYNVLHKSPELVHGFYKDMSQVCHAEAGTNGIVNTVITQAGIRELITSLDYGDIRPKIATIDSQESLNGSVIVMVTGVVFNKIRLKRKFVQTFFLAPQEKGLFILNDVFRYLDEDPYKSNQNLAPSAPSANGAMAMVPDLSIPEQSAPREVETMEDTEGFEEDSENQDGGSPPSAVEFKGKDQVLPSDDNLAMAVSGDALNLNASTHGTEAQQSHIESGATLHADRSLTPSLLGAGQPPLSSSTDISMVENDNDDDEARQVDAEGDNRSIYIKNLPVTITQDELEKEFEQFGTFKPGGVNLRNQKVGVCFAFIEYEDSSSAQKAIEASPLTIGGRQVFVEQKRTMAPQAGRGKFNQGRGYQNEGSRRRGYYGGRGYVRNMGQNPNRGYKRGRGAGANRGGYGNAYGSRGASANTYRRSDQQGGNADGNGGSAAQGGESAMTFA